MLSISRLTVAALLGASTAFASAINDYSCESSSNPVVLLHGLGATYYEDLNFLQFWLQNDGYCTYSLTYGAYEGFPFVGGLKPIKESAPEIAAFIKEVVQKTGKSKVNLVGHSEGAFQSLYVPKFEGVLDTVGCGACNDLGPDGAAVDRLNDGTPILQPGNEITVIASKSDELVTPPETAFIHEAGVKNTWIQDTCPLDPVGHIGEAYDLNVWNLVKNALDSTPDRKFVCVLGSPGK
ncbi:hypothetical protein N7468_004875 [Penicillium chermesinum]|uniref:Lipase n=1 Tax=Penicillium chermesinum TaxID=63820 RepID=A0A9W9P950_9EURO|nr:uncharacterized protein N7468_004875 [Penicillium chermesinum]KAJ5240256.1 hypothetical protein N7468_004875 [Penicillium chermesinum]